MTVRLINLGLPKSGTTTLARALSSAGWRVADHKVRRSDSADPDRAGTFVARQIYRGYFDTGDPLKNLDFYDALSEISALRPPLSLWPQCDYAVLKAMRSLHPTLRFVATRRPSADISDSMRRWNSMGEDRLPAGSVPGLPIGWGAKDADRVRWIDGHYDMLRDLFGDDPRYLELEVGAPDARNRLEAHLGLDLPWWGRANANPVAP